MLQAYIRNFAIIAHIDHGKSTLADRLMEITGAVEKRNLVEQTLDSHPISRERGITIRLAPVTMGLSVVSDQLLFNKPQITNNQQPTTNNYVLNLIDTPGHVDFSYEVERSLAACEGAILLVDATQGVQAQTLSNFYKASKLNLKIIPVINKIDMPNARVSQVAEELNELLKNYSQEQKVKILHISAKTGQGIDELLKELTTNIPPPSGDPSAHTRALIFSSQFDSQRGVIAFVRIVDGNIRSRDQLYFLATQTHATAFELGHFKPNMSPKEILNTGEVGYIITNVKDPSLVKVGDTITIDNSQPIKIVPLPGYHEPKSMVFVSFFPVDQDDFELLQDALEKLRLNDAALSFVRTESKALGRGFRVGFLGHLHAEVTQERLSGEFDLSVIATTPTVEYHKINQSDENYKLKIENSYSEPWVKATIFTPEIYVGTIMNLSDSYRGKLIDMLYQGSNVILTYELPLGEIITNFFDQLKSKTSGYASLDYELLEYRPFDSVQLDILINHEYIDALSIMVEKNKAQTLGNQLVEKLKEAIPRQQISIPIQASINGQIIARADIPSFRKDVTAKLYGGDRTRRMKLLEKQKKGKEKMKNIGQITIPNDVFLKIFKT